MSWHFSVLRFFAVTLLALSAVGGSRQISGNQKYCTGTISQVEYNSLMDLYMETGGLAWTWPDDEEAIPWQFPSTISDPCGDLSWYGLECDDLVSEDRCTISSLDLSHLALRGTIPASLASLTSLVSLNLGANYLTGSIPSQLGLIHTLQLCSLRSNALTGTVPPDVLRLPSLTTLSLYYNQLSGPILTEISHLTALSRLELYVNSFSGPIPTSMGLVTSLEFVFLENNHFTGTVPQELFALPLCQILYFGSNRLEGRLPESMAGLPSLLYFSASYNLFTGPLPTDMWTLPALSVFDVAFNQLSGSLPLPDPVERGSAAGDCVINTLTVNGNQLTGSIPEAIFEITTLSTFDLSVNNLTGTISPLIGRLTSVSTLHLDSNRLTGSLPTELGLLSLLQTLVISDTNITGVIPTELAALGRLSKLLLQSNSLTGSIPDELGYNQGLTMLYLFDNSLSLTIPDSLANLTKLTSLYLQGNSLTGTIPTAMGSMPSLQELYVYSNSFTGPLPVHLVQLPRLLYLGLNNNLFSGTISRQLGNMSSLMTLTMGFNFLWGTVPVDLLHLTALKYLNAESNVLSGDIGLLLREAVHLRYLVLSSNLVDGSISELGENNWRNELRYVILDDNKISGSVPPEMALWSNLQVLNLNHNRLVGHIPDLQLLVSLEELYLSGNMLTGSVPASIAALSRLLEVDLSENRLSSSLPPNLLQTAHRMQLLNVSFNLLSGRLDQVFPPALNSSLVFVDLSHNAFSGSIPSHLFALTTLRTVSMYSNCFVGRVPDSICQASSLQVLILNGLGSAEQCRLKIPLLSMFEGYCVEHFLIGSIPRCIWDMASLQTLQLSGNALSGPLGEIPSSSQLRNLNVECNTLTGNIPLSLQRWGKFDQLGLSSNRLSGTLDSFFAVPASGCALSLSVNRLSGIIPDSLYKVSGLDILDGNLFQCSGGEMPSGDPQHKRSQCGSDNMDAALAFSWSLAAIAAVGLVYLVTLRSSSSGSAAITLSRIQGAVWMLWYGWTALTFVDSKQELSNYKNFLRLLSRLRLAACVLSGVYCTLCMGTYIGLKLAGHGYGTHSVQYTWIASSAYLRGAIPVALVLLCVLGSHQLLLWCDSVTIVSPNSSSSFSTVLLSEIPSTGDMMAEDTLSETELSQGGGTREAGRQEEVKESVKLTPREKFQQLVKDWIIPLLFQLVNATVIIAVNGVYVAFVFQKLSRGPLLSVQAALGLFKLGWNQIYLPWSISRLRWLSPSRRMSHQTFMGLFNYVTGPVLATYLTDSNCLFFALFGQSAVSSSYQQSQSTGIECAQSFVNSSNTIVCRATTTETSPSASLSPPWIYSNQCSSALITNYVPVFLFAYSLSGVLIPLVLFAVASLSNQSFYRFIPRSFRDIFIRGTVWDTRDSEVTAALYGQTVVDNSLPSTDRIKGVFNATTVVCGLLLDFAVLTTFGLASPLLSGVVTIKVISSVGLWRVLIDRYLGLQTLMPSAMCCQRVEAATESVRVGCGSGLFVVVLVGALFWGLVVLDMVSDVYGYVAGAVAVLTCILGIPLLFKMSQVGGFFCHRNRFRRDETSCSNHYVAVNLS